ncbi:MAG: M48 family metallopeptidase [Desulfobacterales bacterium]|nr:M48 family metallopeptidase [Desulfobacterales bacterium]
MIPLTKFLFVFIIIYVISYLLNIATEILNKNYLKRYMKAVPEAFKETIGKNELEKISHYTIDNIRFTIFQTSINKLFFLFIILSGILPWLSNSMIKMNFLPAGLIFFTVPGLLTAIIDLPFDYYHNFVIEQRYGFNTKTLKIWILDLIKSFIVLVVIGIPLLSALLLTIKYTGPNWWVWAWSVFLGFQLVVTILYPTVIAPVFNKFTPLEDSNLKSKIERLAKGEGLSIEGIYQMDATRRTRHTNAYFSGLGKTKRIVLFDSLIQSHNQEEISAILAHEIGHLKKNHIKKQMAIIAISSFLLFYLASKLFTWKMMFESFGFTEMPFYVGLFLVGVLWEPISFFLSPITMAISRKFEREADFYSFEILKTAKPLISALKKMGRDNLSNLHPHPFYVWFHYSHPPRKRSGNPIFPMGFNYAIIIFR